MEDGGASRPWRDVTVTGRNPPSCRRGSSRQGARPERSPWPPCGAVSEPGWRLGTLARRATPASGRARTGRSLAIQSNSPDGTPRVPPAGQESGAVVALAFDFPLPLPDGTSPAGVDPGRATRRHVLTGQTGSAGRRGSLTGSRVRGRRASGAPLAAASAARRRARPRWRAGRGERRSRPPGSAPAGGSGPWSRRRRSSPPRASPPGSPGSRSPTD
jgi:hypothetical protein